MRLYIVSEKATVAQLSTWKNTKTQYDMSAALLEVIVGKTCRSTYFGQWSIALFSKCCVVLCCVVLCCVVLCCVAYTNGHIKH